MTRARAGALALTVLVVAAILAGCGSSSGGGVTNPTVAAARQFTIGGFSPAGTVAPGKPITVSFTVKMPNGKPLTQYKTGTGPHTGVHLIIVRNDLAYIVHEHPPIGPDGLLKQRLTLPAAGPYHVLVDVYPDLKGVLPNFQLFTKINVKGAYHPQQLPSFKPDLTVDGYHFDMTSHPTVHAIQATFLKVHVTDPQGKNVHFVPWFGALAHAIFFRQGTLDYFHTHICAANAPNCGSLAGVTSSRIAGSSTSPGHLTVGVLLALPGTWRLFVQMKLHGQIVTAPFTLHVK